jgi:hypothetical protein
LLSSAGVGIRAAMSAELIVKMKARIDQCRRLAHTITDPRSRKILLDMADQGEADMRQFQAEEAARQAADRPGPPSAG